MSIGGKGSTDYAVKGSHKDAPQELIDELKAICQVWYQTPFILMPNPVVLGLTVRLSFY